jgi:hypothetical protein
VDKAGLEKFRGAGWSRFEVDWLFFAHQRFRYEFKVSYRNVAVNGALKKTLIAVLTAFDCEPLHIVCQVQCLSFSVRLLSQTSLSLLPL